MISFSVIAHIANSCGIKALYWWDIGDARISQVIPEILHLMLWYLTHSNNRSVSISPNIGVFFYLDFLCFSFESYIRLYFSVTSHFASVVSSTQFPSCISLQCRRMQTSGSRFPLSFLEPSYPA